MVGFNADFVPYNVFNLVSDNVKLAEIKNDDGLARKYGVDHLFATN